MSMFALGQRAKFPDDQRMSALAGTSKGDISRIMSTRPSHVNLKFAT
jgi:hypothetical protein